MQEYLVFFGIGGNRFRLCLFVLSVFFYHHKYSVYGEKYGKYSRDYGAV